MTTSAAPIHLGPMGDDVGGDGGSYTVGHWALIPSIIRKLLLLSA